MILALFLSLSRLLASVSAGPEPLPPGDVELQEGALLSWSPGGGVSFTVQAWSWERSRWEDVVSCVRMAAPPCDVSALVRGGAEPGVWAEPGAEPGCVPPLQVKGHRGGAESEAVEACTRNNSTCTPQVSLLPLPGSLTVHLPRSHLWQEHADHAQYEVCVWRQGRQERSCRESVSSTTFWDLDEGQTYCAAVRHLLYGRPEGPPRCPVCRRLPPSPPSPPRHACMGLEVVLPIAALILGSAAAYVLIFHRDRVKQWLKPTPTPQCLSLPSEGAALCTPTEEQCCTITGFTELNPD